MNPPIEIENVEYGTKTYVRQAAVWNDVYINMHLKKQITPKKEDCVHKAMMEALDDLEDTYREYIRVTPSGLVFVNNPKNSIFVSDSKYGFIALHIQVEQSFAREHLYFNKKFAPEKYLGFYMSRVARKLCKKYKYFSTVFRTGMFTYEFHY